MDHGQTIELLLTDIEGDVVMDSPLEESDKKPLEG